eukprot:m.112 g.112  ORF g.112 m.112 type:complete len:68 (+) comp578_c0_seq1:312-515(+)
MKIEVAAPCICNAVGFECKKYTLLIVNKLNGCDSSFNCTVVWLVIHIKYSARRLSLLQLWNDTSLDC